MIPRLDPDGVARFGPKPRKRAPRTREQELARRKAEPGPSTAETTLVR